MADIVAHYKYSILYLDNYFAKLKYLDDDIVTFEKRSILPKDICEGDIIQEFYNRDTKETFYEIIEKSNNINFDFNKLCLICKDSNKTLLCKNGTEKAEETTLTEEGVGMIVKEKFVKNKLFTKIINEFRSVNNIKKVSKFNFSRWVVFEIYNHTICLANINNIDEKRYIPDVELELNAYIGDLYYYLELDKKSEYIYDEEANNTKLHLCYSKIIRELIAKASENKTEVIDFKLMEELDKKASKLFSKLVPYKYENNWVLEELENHTDRGDVYRAYDLNDEEKAIFQDELPKFAREGDVVALNIEGEYVFDREALLDAIQEFKKSLLGAR